MQIYMAHLHVSSAGHLPLLGFLHLIVQRRTAITAENKVNRGKLTFYEMVQRPTDSAVNYFGRFWVLFSQKRK